jgi:hypothetical protein
MFERIELEWQSAETLTSVKLAGQRLELPVPDVIDINLCLKNEYV